MLKSHPDKMLKNHLIGTKNWGEHFLSLSPCPIIEQNCQREMVQNFLLLHDIGKATVYFQDYINGKKVDAMLKTHSHLSALIFLKYQILQGNIETDEIPIKLMYLSILKHHDNLTTLMDATHFSEEEQELLEIQWNHIDKKELAVLFQEIGLDKTITQLEFNELKQGIKELTRKWRKEYSQKEEKVKEKAICDMQEYILLQNLYSLLIDADKSEVTLCNTEFVKNVPYCMDIPLYLQSKKKKKDSELNVMRNQAFKEVEQSLTEIGKQSIFSLTLPTGMGKTLTILNFASQLKKELEEKEGKCYKIIYALPFMSIIDQTAQEIETILATQNAKVDNYLLTKHHHLAELEWKIGEEVLKETNLSKMLIEGWNSQIVITTFIQLLGTLIGYRNASQRKYHQLNNAILIFDEIQSVPVKYYALLRKMFLEFTKYSNSKIILMTATQPHIMKEGEIFPLCKSEKYYLPLKRTKVININKEQTIQEWVETYDYQKGKTYLFIQNTISASLELYERLKEKYPNLAIVLLNTNFPPFIRKKVIQKIKKKQYNIVVSTQLVEAGVDIDFDIVFRDFAPLPQILQSAGRANREGLRMGEVYITKFINNKGKTFCSYIYDLVDLEITQKVIGGEQEFLEQEFIKKIQEYYKKVEDEFTKSQDESIKIMRGLNVCNCYKEREENFSIGAASDFRLIDEKNITARVLIEFEEVKEIWQEYMKLCEQNEKNNWEKAAKIQNVQREMEEFVINVQMTKKFLEQNMPPLVNGYYYVSNDMIPYYYSKEKGFGISDVIFM